MQVNHRERISLFLIDSPAFPVVLGGPFLASHNPRILWRQGVLQGWSEESSGRFMGVSIGAMSVESPDQVSTVRIPSEYADLAIAFCKKRATKLPPHRQRDCVINFQVNAVLPRSHVDPLLQEETLAMETCHRIFGTGVHSALHLTRLLEFLFREEKGGRSESVH
jgi:hypothetical protein